MTHLFHVTSKPLAEAILKEGFCESQRQAFWFLPELTAAPDMHAARVSLEVEIALSEVEKLAYQREILDREVDPITNEPLADGSSFSYRYYEIPVAVLRARTTMIRVFAEHE